MLAFCLCLKTVTVGCWNLQRDWINLNMQRLECCVFVWIGLLMAKNHIAFFGGLLWRRSVWLTCSSILEAHIAFHREDAGTTYLPTNSHDVTYQEKTIFILCECLRVLNVLFVTTRRRNLWPTTPLCLWVSGTERSKRESEILFPDKGEIKILFP